MAKTPWHLLLELHVVKSTAKLLERRWGLGFGYVDARGINAQAPRGGGHRLEIICDRVQRSPAGTVNCGRSARLLAESLGGDCASSCHVGLHQLVAPIRVADRVVGAFVAGGFLATDSEPAVIKCALEKLGLGGDVLVDELFVADEDIAFAKALLDNAAEEAADFLQSRGLHGADVRDRYGAIVGISPPMQELFSLLDRVVKSETTVLVQGENGTGKELVARAIHENSRRKDRPFVVQNCSAFNDNLLDSELFGHRRGAFTGAVTDKDGLFQVADQGTFFLDEIGDMSQALQVKVLRVLQEGTFTPVGDTRERHVDVRIVAATNRDLRAMVAAGQFREDLYYRINVINLMLPPLRARRDDIPLLAEQFLQRQCEQQKTNKRLSTGCVERLVGYEWPGNVRELENEIERAVVLSGDASTIDEQMLSRRIQGVHGGGTAGTTSFHDLALPKAVEMLERRMITAALERHHWNKTRAATELEVSRRNLIRMVQKYNLED